MPAQNYADLQFLPPAETLRVRVARLLQMACLETESAFSLSRTLPTTQDLLKQERETPSRGYGLFSFRFLGPVDS